MITVDQFNALQTTAGAFAHTSMTYLDAESVRDYEVLCENDQLILLRGHSDEHMLDELHWAADDASILLAALAPYAGYLVSFVPPAWKAQFESAGFSEYAVYREYWLENLQLLSMKDTPDCAPLLPQECEQAAAVTMACRDQSRGFHGETAAWVAQWLAGQDPALSADGRATALCHCNAAGSVDGVAFIAWYPSSKSDLRILWARELAVHPAAQGRGVGAALLHAALRWGQQEGATRAFLMADECNDTAVRLYLSAGFVPHPTEVQIDMSTSVG